MAIDGMVIRAIVHELQTCVGGRIHKIHQPFERDVIFQLRAQRENRRMLLSANPTYPRLHLTSEQFENPAEPPMFCMFLRKHCENGIIQSIEQVGNERIIYIRIHKRDELGDLSLKTMIVELMGRHSNLILVDPQKNLILDSIHHVTPAINSYRVVMPGQPYTPPPEQNKQDPFSIDDVILQRWINEHSNRVGLENPKLLEQQIIEDFSGVSPLMAKEWVARGLHTLPEIIHQLKNHDYVPNIVHSPTDDKSYFSVLQLTHLTDDLTAQSQVQNFASVHDCLQSFYAGKVEKDFIKQRVGNLYRLLQNELSKNEKKLKKLNNTLNQSEQADQYRIMGELLTASLHQIKKGAKQAEVVNYYEEDQRLMQIKLDEKKSPAENAQYYFKKYAKLKNGAHVVSQQIEATREEIQYLQQLQHQLDEAGLNDINEIKDELVDQGYLKKKQKTLKKTKKNKDIPALACYFSSEGIPIYVGKNNKQNEYLTNRLARSNDTWLHTKDMPGSHVVIRSEQYSEVTLEEASQLAAYFSKGKSSSQVPIDYTLIKHVRKPSGAKPGYVIYDHQKTLYITPDESQIQALSSKTPS